MSLAAAIKKIDERLVPSKTVEMKAGQIVYVPHNSAVMFYQILSGYVFTESLDSSFARICGPGDFFGEQALRYSLDRPEYEERARMLQAGMLAGWTWVDLSQGFRDAGFAKSIVQILSGRIEEEKRMRKILAAPVILRRLALFLYEEAEKMRRQENFASRDDSPCLVLPPIRHHQLATLLGTRREIITENMRKLLNRGAISYDRQRIQILDLGLLRSCSKKTD